MVFNKQALRTSLRMLMGRPASHVAPDPAVLEEKADALRALMLASLTPEGAARFPAMARRIGAAPELTDLWYLRGPLMSTLCAIHGEKGAKRRVGSMSAQFEAYLPQGLCSRPSPLSR